jgi:hypothetical protein
LSGEVRRESRFATLTDVYHVELRQFPHNSNRFNLTEGELRATIIDAWARGDWIEFGERKWSPHQATLTVIEGPELPLQQLSLGRGWRNATRQGRDVTEELVASARRRSSGAAPAARSSLGPEVGAGPGSPAGAPLAPLPPAPSAQSLAGELLELLGSDPAPLLRAWQLALERHPDRTPSQCLALAEDLLRG